MTSTGCLAFSTAMRVIYWIHGNAAVMRTPSEPAHASSFADGDVLMIGVSHLTDGGHAIEQNLAGLPRRQLDQRVVTLLRYQLRRSAGGAHHLRTFSRA